MQRKYIGLTIKLIMHTHVTVYNNVHNDWEFHTPKQYNIDIIFTEKRKTWLFFQTFSFLCSIHREFSFNEKYINKAPTKKPMQSQFFTGHMRKCRGWALFLRYDKILFFYNPHNQTSYLKSFTILLNLSRMQWTLNFTVLFQSCVCQGILYVSKN